MIAKYPGRCILCSGGIEVGEEIEWEKGVGASHPRCAQRDRDDHPAAPSSLLEQVFVAQRAKLAAQPPVEPEPDLWMDCPRHGRWYAPGGTCPMCEMLAVAGRQRREGPDVSRPA